MTENNTPEIVTAPCTDCGRMLRANTDGFWPFIADDNSIICDAPSHSYEFGHRLPTEIAHIINPRA
jgi:hypothetical protein